MSQPHTRESYLEDAEPYIRKVHSAEAWYYKNPRTAEYVPSTILIITVLLVVPILFLIVVFFVSRSRTTLTETLWSYSLALVLNGVITCTIKVVVGRPRPDFFYRCFPEGFAIESEKLDLFSECNGDPAAVKEGRKSFPSGHSSLAFAAFGFLSLWLSGILKVFNEDRGHAWKLVCALFPLMTALLVALSRTCDYHHHWQDVVVGSLIGMVLAYMCYRQYFPRLTSEVCNIPYQLLAQNSISTVKCCLNGHCEHQVNSLNDHLMYTKRCRKDSFVKFI